MATAYVSPIGSAAYPGTIAAPTSLATALSSAGAGDIVYLAPGNYRGTFTVGVSGTAGNTIQFIGDVTASQSIGGIAGGVVRVTNYLADNTFPTIATLLTATSRSYFSFANIYFESHHNSAGYLGIFTTCTNWSFEKCAFITIRSGGLTVTTSAGVALNASFTKCTFSTSNINVILYCANHTSSYSLNLSFTDCVSVGASAQQLTNMSATSTPGSLTNAGGITYYNCTCYGFMIQNYSTNTTHPSYVYNCVVISGNGNSLLTQTSGSLIENYNYVTGAIYNITQGLNSLYTGAVGLDFGYSAINGISAPSVHGPYLGSRLIGAGTVTGAPATDADGVAWYQSLLDIGAYTYAGRNNVITFPVTPLPYSYRISPGSTSQSIELYLGATGLTPSTVGLVVRYNRSRSSSVVIPLVTRTITQPWIAGGFAEVDPVGMPGVYRLDIPNEALLGGVDDCTVVVKGASNITGAVLTVRLEQQNTLISTTGYKLISDQMGANGILDVIKGSSITVKLQMVDVNNKPIPIGTAACTVEVYSINNLVETYPTVIQYQSNGELTFVLDTQVTATPGAYNIYVVRNNGGSDTVLYGPMKLVVSNL